jgi:hypothetical protein
LLLSDRRLSLGRLVHCEVHEAMGSYRGRVRVPWRSASIVGGGARFSEEQPTDELADAIDRHMGRGDYWLMEVQRLEPALEKYRAYDPLLADVVWHLCIAARTSVIPGWRIKHQSAGSYVERAPFHGDWRKLQRYMKTAWEGLGILLTRPAALKKAISAGVVDQRILDDFQRRGFIGFE